MRLLLTRWLHGDKKKNRQHISFEQAVSSLSQMGLASSLIRACVDVLADVVRINGETEIGPQTIQQIKQCNWFFTEAELELLYEREAVLIHQYVNTLYVSLDTPPEIVLTMAVSTYSHQAKQAYIFLTEAISRMVYDVLYGYSSDRRQAIPPQVVHVSSDKMSVHGGCV